MGALSGGSMALERAQRSSQVEVKEAASQYKRDKNFLEKGWEYVSEKTKKFYRKYATLSQIVLLAAGAWGMYKLISYFSKKKTEKERTESRRTLNLEYHHYELGLKRYTAVREILLSCAGRRAPRPPSTM